MCEFDSHPAHSNEDGRSVVLVLVSTFGPICLSGEMVVSPDKVPDYVDLSGQEGIPRTYSGHCRFTKMLILAENF